MAKQFKKESVAGREVFTKPIGKIALVPLLPSWLNRDWFLGLILVLAVILTYQPVWYAGFIWSDDGRLTANPCIVGPLGLKEIWMTKAADLCPFVYTTFWMEHALWGLPPLPYHLVNVLLHGASAILLWRVLQSLQVPGAWLGAALWALHPVEVESVAWISEMKNTESGVFYLLTILFFVRWLKAGNLDGGNGGGRDYAFTLLFAALALTSKSSTVMLPIVLGLCAWWVEGRWQWRNLTRLGPIAVMAVFPSAVTLWTQKMLAQSPYDLRHARSWPERLVTAGDAVWFYLDKLAWPHSLIFIYPRWEVDAGSWFSWLPLLAVIIVLVVLWLKRESWSRPFFFTFAYFLSALLPVLGLVDGYFWRYSLVADHFQYLASIGPLALAGAGLAKLADVVMPGRSWLQSSLYTGLLLILGLLSWQRTWVFQNQETLWTDTLAKNSNCEMAHNNFGLALKQKGQMDEAMAQFQIALEIDRDDDNAHSNLGIALAQEGQMDEAMAQFQIALKIDPRDAGNHGNLGLALMQKGQVDEAITEYQTALKIDPNHAEIHYNLGNALFNEGRTDEAIAEYLEALRLQPDYTHAQNHLAIAQGIVAQRKTQK